MIDSLIEIIPSGILQGLILSLLAIGVMIPFLILNFPDLTAEGAYPLGAVISASLIVSNFNPILSILIATIFAGLLGIGTAFLNIKYKVNSLLAGIILSTMVYSINLRLMGKPNIAIFNYDTIFDGFGSGFTYKILILLVITLTVIAAILWFLNTEKGLQFRAVGQNPEFAKKQSINLKANIFLGLFVGNALCGLAGALMVQIQSYADVTIGVGIVIHTLAAIMIGEKIVGTNSLTKLVFSPIIGALIYQQIQGIALTIGLAPSDLKFLTGSIVLFIIALKK